MRVCALNEAKSHCICYGLYTVKNDSIEFVERVDLESVTLNVKHK